MKRGNWAWTAGLVIASFCTGYGEAAEVPETVGTLRQALQDLLRTEPARYPRGSEYLAKLDSLETKLRQGDASAPAELEKLQREALLANPLVSGQPLLFVVRRQYAPDHHNTATFFPAAEREFNDGHFTGGGAIKTLDVATGRATTLLDLPEGVARDPDVHFDGKRLVFSMRRSVKDSYHIYEMNADGTGLKPLTRAADVDDLDPFYLADDDIAFSSTRQPKYCMCNRHIMANLYRMEPDGANILQIGKSTLFEGHGSLTPDGRILYDRWEYVDRNFGDAQALWTVNPDGTEHNVYWGNNTPAPGAVLEGRAIPGTQQVLCIFSSCHDRPWGAMAIVDRRLGLDGKKPVVRTWPANAVERVRDPGTANNDFDAFTGLPIKYEDPFPLNDKYFLCSRKTGQSDQMGIYLLDTFGNEVLVHAEGPGCFDPMPLAPRPRPPVVAMRRDMENGAGTVYVQNVYLGTHMKDVKPGSIKALRVVETPEKRFWTRPAWNGQGQEAPGMNWHDFNNKVILGTVPVEADGSAYFTMPAERFVYFQLLDENGMMVQSMRSGMIMQSGQHAGCVGCHENRLTAPPPTSRQAMALRRPPSQLTGWRGQERPFNYLRDVQPVFDQHCVNCHDFGKPTGAKLNLARDRTLVFNVSYAELWSKQWVKVAGAGPAQTLQAKSWGSHASRLTEFVRNAHEGVKLDSDAQERVLTWIDLNAPYYPSYATAFPDNAFGRAPLNDNQMERLRKLVGVPPWDQPFAISFDRPELSPYLRGLKDKSDPRWAEALEVINEGRKALETTPNPDNDTFVPCRLDQWRAEKYLRRDALQQQAREAIRKGMRVYDPAPGPSPGP